MFDLKNLDNLFNDSSLNKRVNADQAALLRHRKTMRLIKIGFPAAAAALIGLLAIFPSLRDRGDFSIQISKPSRQELEKLHMENTVLYVTDKNNRVNSFTAENIDETEPGSQLAKISNTQGKIPTSDKEWLDVTAPFGFFDQKNKLLSLMEDVNVKYSGGMTAHTEELHYDSQAAKAYGGKPITVSGNKGNLKSEGFEYYTDSELAVFIGKTEIHTGAFDGQTDVYADKRTEFYRKEQKLKAIGNAVMTRGGIKVSGDVLTAVFAQGTSGKNEITDFEGNGNVTVDNGKNKVYADALKTFFTKDKTRNTVIDRIEMTGHVKTKTADGEVYADKGIYYPRSGDVKLENNIVIIKNGNKMQGTSAETNLNTGITKISAGARNRVSGVFYEDSLPKNK